MGIKLAILSAALTITPLADEDNLEPSVLNEVEHALNLASTNSVSVTPEAIAFAKLYATNGLSVTARAIALVSMQKDGRWFYQGVEVTPVAVCLLRRAAGIPEPTRENKEDARNDRVLNYDKIPCRLCLPD